MSFLIFLIRKKRLFFRWIQRRFSNQKDLGQVMTTENIFSAMLPGIVVFFAFIAFFYLNYSILPQKYPTHYSRNDLVQAIQKPRSKVTHVATPKQVKAIYMSSWVAGTKNIRSRLINIIDTTEINAVMIDIKDYTGNIAFDVNDPYLIKEGAVDRRIKDLGALIEELHKKNVYVIGRIAVFQDPHMVSRHPEWAVKTKDGKIWKDRKGISWIDAGSTGMWKYIVALAKESYAQGFDEINFDYIRYPSDGNMSDMVLPITGTRVKADVLKSFFAYLEKSIKSESAADAISESGKPTFELNAKKTSTSKNRMVTSADLFGMTTTATNDLMIGQRLEDALQHFDYVAPMVYPSHYPAGFMGYANPATKPYEIIKMTMGSAVERARAASTSPSKLRPWLQDFSLGATYTPEMVRAQIQATYDVGLTSWMLWDPNNRYSVDALLK